MVANLLFSSHKCCLNNPSQATAVGPTASYWHSSLWVVKIPHCALWSGLIVRPANPSVCPNPVPKWHPWKSSPFLCKPFFWSFLTSQFSRTCWLYLWLCMLATISYGSVLPDALLFGEKGTVCEESVSMLSVHHFKKFYVHVPYS